MDGSVIVVEITDDAKPFDPSGVAQPDTGIPLEDRPVGGLGIHLVREMMDGFRYRRSGEHNIVTFTKKKTRRMPGRQHKGAGERRRAVNRACRCNVEPDM